MVFGPQVALHYKLTRSWTQEQQSKPGSVNTDCCFKHALPCKDRTIITKIQGNQSSCLVWVWAHLKLNEMKQNTIGLTNLNLDFLFKHWCIFWSNEDCHCFQRAVQSLWFSLCSKRVGLRNPPACILDLSPIGNNWCSEKLKILQRWLLSVVQLNSFTVQKVATF